MEGCWDLNFVSKKNSSMTHIFWTFNNCKSKVKIPKLQFYPNVRLPAHCAPHPWSPYLEDIDGSWLDTWRIGSSLTCWIILEDLLELTLKVSWRSDLIWMSYKDLKKRVNKYPHDPPFKTTVHHHHHWHHHHHYRHHYLDTIQWKLNSPRVSQSVSESVSYLTDQWDASQLKTLIT